MRQDMLPRQLDKFIENLPKMQNVEVSNDEGTQEPVTQMHKIIVVKV